MNKRIYKYSFLIKKSMYSFISLFLSLSQFVSYGSPYIFFYAFSIKYKMLFFLLS